MSRPSWTELQNRLKKEREQLPAQLFTETKCDVPEEIGLAIVERLINGESVNDILKTLPGVKRGMINWWLVGGQKGGAAGVLSANYTRIREAQAARLGQQAIELIDNMAAGEGDFRHTRVALDGTRWILGRLDALRWSDNVNVKHSGSVSLNAIVEESRKKRTSLLDQAKDRVIESTAETVSVEPAKTAETVDKSST